MYISSTFDANSHMKKEKNESPVKTARKKAKDSIESRLTKTLKSIAAELGQEAIDIEKTAKKLAKKLTKGFKAGKDAAASKIADMVNPPKGGVAPKAVAAPKAKPAIVATKKPVAKAAPAKTAAPAKISTAKTVKK
jgi:hypothetical protein